MRLEFVYHGCIDGRSSQKGDRSLGWSLASLVMKRVREEWPMKQPVLAGPRCVLQDAFFPSPSCMNTAGRDEDGLSTVEHDD